MTEKKRYGLTFISKKQLKPPLLYKPCHVPELIIVDEFEENRAALLEQITRTLDFCDLIQAGISKLIW